MPTGRKRHNALIEWYLSRPRLREFVRFCLVGLVATGLHYGIYFLLIRLLPRFADGVPFLSEPWWIDAAYSIGYALSLCCNLWLTAHFTFRTGLNIKKGGGFILSHIVNYILHLLLLHLFLWTGLSPEWAPLPVFVIVTVVNFLLVRTVFHARWFQSG